MGDGDTIDFVPIVFVVFCKILQFSVKYFPGKDGKEASIILFQFLPPDLLCQLLLFDSYHEDMRDSTYSFDM